MAQTMPRYHLTLNTDGRRHPLENTATMLAALLTVVAGICALIHSTHIAASWAGFAGVAVGLWAQMISATTAERFINVCAMVISGVALMFGLAHGGLY
jgi:uncharacterized ion transporter superfamily protein YfcC